MAFSFPDLSGIGAVPPGVHFLTLDSPVEPLLQLLILLQVDSF